MTDSETRALERADRAGDFDARARRMVSRIRSEPDRVVMEKVPCTNSECKDGKVQVLDGRIYPGRAGPRMCPTGETADCPWLDCNGTGMISKLRRLPGYRRRVEQAAHLGDVASRLALGQEARQFVDDAFDVFAGGLANVGARWEVPCDCPRLAHGDQTCCNGTEKTTGLIFDHVFLVRCAVAAAKCALARMQCACGSGPGDACHPNCPGPIRWAMANRAIEAAEVWLECPTRAPAPEITVSENDWSRAWWDRLGALISGRVAQVRWAIQSAIQGPRDHEVIRHAVRTDVVPWLLA